MQKRILLASHGSRGSVAAELSAVLACHPQDQLDHLYVIPSWWGDMTGDDWLNNGVSRNRFRNYLSEQLWRESQQVTQRVRHMCMRSNIVYRPLVQIGRSDQRLEVTARQTKYDRIFLGSRRPRHQHGLCDRMLTARIEKQFAEQLQIVSYPHE